MPNNDDKASRERLPDRGASCLLWRQKRITLCRQQAVQVGQVIDIGLLLTLVIRSFNHSHTPKDLVDEHQWRFNDLFTICGLVRPSATLRRSAQTNLVRSNSKEWERSLELGVEIYLACSTTIPSAGRGTKVTMNQKRKRIARHSIVRRS